MKRLGRMGSNLDLHLEQEPLAAARRPRHPDGPDRAERHGHGRLVVLLVPHIRAGTRDPARLRAGLRHPPVRRDHVVPVPAAEVHREARRPQIGMSFENYRGQPDLLEHAKARSRSCAASRSSSSAAARCPRACCCRAPGHRQDVPRRVIAAEAKLPFIYIDASSLRACSSGHDQLMVMKLFRDARGLARKYASPGKRGACIMFLDEIDSIGMNRGGQGGDGHGRWAG